MDSSSLPKLNLNSERYEVTIPANFTPLWQGAFLDGNLLLAGQPDIVFAGESYVLAYELVSHGVLFSGTLSLVPSHFTDGEELITACLAHIEKDYIAAVSKDLSAEVNAGALPN